MKLCYFPITLPEGTSMEYDILIQLFITVERVVITLCCMYVRNILNHVPTLRNFFMGNYKVVNLSLCPLHEAIQDY